MIIFEVGNGSRHTHKSTWDDGYTAHPKWLRFYYIKKEVIYITIGEKIKVILEYRHMTVQELSIKMDYNSPSALYNRFKRDNFSESDLQEICKVLNCSYDVIIKMNDTGKEV